jgi:hypothetical protein
MKCGKRYLEVRESDLCLDCRIKEENDFIKVNKFIYDNPSANIAEVADATEVTEEDIIRWQETGKITEYIRPSLRCSVCGKAIKVGRICKRCQSGLKPDLADNDEEILDYSNMHTLRKKR